MRLLTVCAALLVLADPGLAQTKLLFNSHHGQDDAVQSCQIGSFSIGHRRWKTRLRLEPFVGTDASRQALSQRATVFGAGVFYEFHVGHLNWELGYGGQAGFREKLVGGLFVGVRL